MTTPVDIVMPYGVTVVGDGSNYPAIDGDHPRKVTGSSIELTPGPCKVSASWEGPDRAILQVSNGGKTRSLATIPEKTGGGSRSVMVPIGARKGDRVFLFGNRLTAGATGTLEVYPLNFE